MSRHILFDCQPDPGFIAGLEQTTGHKWHTHVADGTASVPKYLRLFRYFAFPLIFLLSTHIIKEVIAWQQFYGILTSVYARFLKAHFPITIMTFIYRPKSGVAGRLFHHLVKFGILNQDVKHIIVFSQKEVELYSSLFPEAAKKFVFLPLGISSIRPAFEETHKNSPAYIFSAGRSNRDYATLKKAAEAASVPLRIACPEESSDGFTYTKILTDCFGTHTEREINGSIAVAIPLREEAISSGQLVALQAMRAGKPLIVSAHTSLSPYIKEGKTAIVCHTQSQWEKAITALRENPGLAHRMGEAGQELFRSHFTLYRLGRDLGSLI